MSDDFELCIARISQCDLSDHQLATVNNLRLLISVREGDHLLLGFTSYEIAELINELAIMWFHCTLTVNIFFFTVCIIYVNVYHYYVYDANKINKPFSERHMVYQSAS